MAKKGVTLIEVMVAMAGVSILFMGLGMILSSVRAAYVVNSQSNDAVTKLSAVFQRVEGACVESPDETAAAAGITGVLIQGGIIRGIRVRSVDGSQFWYWWNSGDRNFYRSTETNTVTVNDDIAVFNSNVSQSSVRINDFRFEIYSNINNRTDIIPPNIAEANLNQIRYIKMTANIVGNSGGSNSINYIFSTGFFIR